MRIFSKRNVLNILLLIIITIIFFKFINARESFSILAGASLPLVGIAAFLYAVQQPLRGLRFGSILSPFGITLPLDRNVSTHLITPLLARVTPGKIGEGAKVFMLLVEKKMLAMAFIVEKLFDFMVLTLFAAPIALLVSELRIAFIAFIILFVVGVLLLWFSDPFLSFIAKVGSKISPLKITFEEKWFSRHIHQIGIPHFVFLFLQSVFVWGINFVALYILGKAISIEVSFFAFVSIISISILIGVVSGLPGGFGAREASLTFLLVTFGASTNSAGAYSLLLVIFILIVEGICALFGWVLYRKTIIQDGSFVQKLS